LMNPNADTYVAAGPFFSWKDNCFLFFGLPIVTKSGSSIQIKIKLSYNLIRSRFAKQL
jgi:hypothetical protein